MSCLVEIEDSRAPWEAGWQATHSFMSRLPSFSFLLPGSKLCRAGPALCLLKVLTLPSRKDLWKNTAGGDKQRQSSVGTIAASGTLLGAGARTSIPQSSSSVGPVRQGLMCRQDGTVAMGAELSDHTPGGCTSSA